MIKSILHPSNKSCLFVVSKFFHSYSFYCFQFCLLDMSCLRRYVEIFPLCIYIVRWQFYFLPGVLPIFAFYILSGISFEIGVTCWYTEPYHHVSLILGFLHGSVVKNIAANEGKAGDMGLNPGWGRFPGLENGNHLQYFCLENPMDRGAWWATVQFSSGQSLSYV